MAGVDKNAGIPVHRGSPASRSLYVDNHRVRGPVLSEQQIRLHYGVDRLVAPLPRTSHTESVQVSNFQFDTTSASNSVIQCKRNRRRRERAQARQSQQQVENRQRKRRFLWNRHQREQRLAAEARRGHDGPNPVVKQFDGRVCFGELNMEGSNQEKLEKLVVLAQRKRWEITVVPETRPTTNNRHKREEPGSTCRFWNYEGWTMIMTNFVGILLDPEWAEAWAAFNFPKWRSETGRVISIVLPRDPRARPGKQCNAQPLVITGVWAPISSASDESLDVFWDEVLSVSTTTQIAFKPQSASTKRVCETSLHLLFGDFNAQVHEGAAQEEQVGIVGRFRPPHRHIRDEYAFDKIAAMNGWVLADSFG